MIEGKEKIWKSSGEVITEVYNNIRAYQKGEMRPARTGLSYIDKALLGGFYPQHAVAIGARPGIGKSYLAQVIMENVMDVGLNPRAGNYAWLRCEFEMNPMDIMLRSLSRGMGMDVERILLTDLGEAGLRRMEDILRKENSSRITYIPRPVTVGELRSFLWDEYMPTKRDKDMVFVSIDHTALVLGGGDPKRNIDDLMAMCNMAKRTFPNIFFLIISQLNRDIEGRKDPKEHAPRQSDFYQSDTLGQLCSAMIALNIPYRLGYTSYMSFPKSWYKYLDRYKTEGGGSFKTEGLIFHHIVKVRQRTLEELDEPIHVDVMRGFERMYGKAWSPKDTGKDTGEIKGCAGRSEGDEMPFDKPVNETPY